MDLAAQGPVSLPALAMGDRVRSSARPEWGPGRVASAPSGGKVCVLFREAGPRTLSLVHAKLEPIADHEPRDAWLEELSLAPLSPELPHTSPRQAAERFLLAYPGGFRDARYQRRERSPLEAAHAILRGTLSRESLRAAGRSRRCEPVCRAACEALSAAKLVPAADAALLRRALESSGARTRLCGALSDLFYSRQAPEVRIERFAAALESIGACRWSLATFFAFARHPDQHCYLRPGETPLAAAALRFDLGFRPAVNGATYARLLRLARALAGELADLEPADFFDVHAFLRSLAAATG
jgi:hypothetical protein